MLAHAGIFWRLVRYATCALLLVIIFVIIATPQGTRAASSAVVRWQSANAAIIQNPKSKIQNLGSILRLALPTWSPNVRANTDNSGFGQHEPGLAVSPANPNVVVIANKDYRDQDIKRVWIEGSTDGGQTWPVQLHMPGLPTTDTESDPVVMARDDGRMYVSCLTTGNNGIFITWTDDNGATWQPSIPIVQNQSALQDKDWFAVDNNPSSPYYHRVYMAWAPGGVVSSYSSDGGLTWTSPQQIPNSGLSIEYPYPVVAPNGDVFLFNLANWGNRAPATSTVKVVKSTNGGVSWSQPITVATILQPNSPPRASDLWRFYSILSAATDPTNNNRLYVAWTDDRNHNTNGMDVMYSASTDHGTTWGPITRLSHDPTGVVRDHITPMLDVSADGRLHSLWLDRRQDTANRLFQAWYSSSTDGGATWEADSQVSDAPGLGFDLNIGLPPGSSNAAGDYWGLDTAGGYIYTAWTDTRNNEQDIYTSKGVQVVTTATPTSTATTTRTPTRTSTATSTFTYTSTPTSTATPTSVLVGHVMWQGRPAQPNALQQVPITLTLKSGTTEVNYSAQTTDSSGFFTITLGSLPGGTYDWRAKGAKWLANSGTVNLLLKGSNVSTFQRFNLPTAPVEMGLMRAGDGDNNNVINITDFNIVKNSFGKSVGDPGYDDRADFNGDNTVNVSDFGLMKANFGQSGAPPI